MTREPNTATINIGDNECRKRRRSSIIAAAVTILIFAALRLSGVESKWYLLLFIPSWIAVLGLLQVKARTCVVFAARGIRNLEGTVENVSDPTQLRALREIAIGIYFKSVMIAVAFTGIVYFAMDSTD